MSSPTLPRKRFDSRSMIVGIAVGFVAALAIIGLNSAFSASDSQGTQLKSVASPSQHMRSGANRVLFEDKFETLDFETWEHEITMGGGG